MKQYLQYACINDANSAIERMQQRQEPHDPQITILSDKIYSQESHTFDTNTWCAILRYLINIQKETSPNQVPFLFLNLYITIFKQLDTLIEQEWKTDPNTASLTIQALAEIATALLVQQAAEDSIPMSTLSQILIYVIANNQHSTIEDLTNGLRTLRSKPRHKRKRRSCDDKSISSPTTPETEEYASKTPSP